MDARGLSYFAIAIAYILVLLPRLYSARLVSQASGAIDNVNPRTAHKRLPEGVDRARIERANAAHANGMESLPVFGLGILCAHQASLSTSLINGIAILYLVCRALYTVIYINQRNAAVAAARSVVFHLGNFAVLALFIKAGLAV